MKPAPLGRDAFRVFRSIASRWSDNDVYGHINNAAYLSFFDTAINGLLVEKGLLNFASSEIVGLVASNGCDYFESLAYPGVVEVGVAVERIGGTSVRYRAGAFAQGAALAAAQGFFVHVHVSRADQRPVAIPPAHRRHFESLLAPELAA